MGKRVGRSGKKDYVGCEETGCRVLDIASLLVVPWFHRCLHIRTCQSVHLKHNSFIVVQLQLNKTRKSKKVKKPVIKFRFLDATAELLYHVGSRNLGQKEDSSCAVKGKHSTWSSKKKSRFEFSVHHLPAVCA